MNRNRLQGGRGCRIVSGAPPETPIGPAAAAPPPLPSAVPPYGTYPYAPLPKRRNIGLLVVVVILIVIVVVVALAAIFYVMTSGLVSGPGAIPPGAPVGLTATAGDATVLLGWFAPPSRGGSSIANYRIYRGTSPNGESLLQTIGNGFSYTDSFVANGQTYYYKVSAVNSAGEGPQSSEAAATPRASSSKPVVTFSSVMKQNAVTWTFAIASASPTVPPSNYKVNFGIGTNTGTVQNMGTNGANVTVTVAGATPASVGVKWTDLGGTGTVKGGDIITIAFPSAPAPGTSLTFYLLYSDGSQIQFKSWQA